MSWGLPVPHSGKGPIYYSRRSIPPDPLPDFPIQVLSLTIRRSLCSLNIEALTLPRPSQFARQKMQSGTGDIKCWVEPDSPSAFNPQVQLGTKIPVVDSWRVMSPPHYSTNGIRPTSFRSWLSLVLLALACVFISRKAPSTPSLDLLTRHPELSSQIFSVERDVVPLPVIKTNLSDNGLTDEVQWDGYSLLLRGQRIFLQ